jgi:hypothetical protein
LTLLGKVRSHSGDPIPLAWTPDWVGRIAAIEVYPAATGIAHGAPQDFRGFQGLEDLFDCDPALHEAPADIQDAMLCVLAGVDFLRGASKPPSKDLVDQVRREGWIWVAERSSTEVTEPSSAGELPETPTHRTALKSDRRADPGNFGPSQDIENIRRRFRPARISTLFIAESPPKGGTFFFSGNSLLYTALREAFDGGADFLDQFRHKGYFLDDLVLYPINHIRDRKVRHAHRHRAVPGLAKRLADYRPAAVVVVMREIEGLVVDAMTRAGLHDVPRCVLPFPRPEHKKRFLREMAKVIPKLPAAPE